MKYSTAEFDAAIGDTGLNLQHQKSLRRLIALRRQPLFVGYIVKGLGLLLLLTPGLFTFLMFDEIKAHGQSDVAPGLENPLMPTMTMLFAIGLFLHYGAQEYLNRTRESRAVCELLMKKHTANNVSEAIGQKVDGSQKPSI